MSESQETQHAYPPTHPAAPIVSSTSSESLSSTVTTSSRLTEASRPTSFPKPSGLKPPSKIGRLCSNSNPKPAVPISPRSDGSSSDTLRKLSDDSSRKHLSDLIEAEEDEVTTSLPDRPRAHRKASTSSTFSISSMDALWEKHPRRLSEAGLRRSSDHSVVLTEDTDSFIIGERVWVGGTKPGQIAYIGETQFAPGEWAGIVLDDAIGKNDGSVAGVRYFQCSEKKGVFSRLTRLTRVPFVTHAPHDASPVSDASSVFERPPSGAARPRRTLSPNGSVRSIVSSKMNASISTTTNGDLRLGDRVIVSSSRGSKAGTLRFVGPTDFATGVWGGVELDDPLGKNDGSVEGKRYFECAARFGLFAPISKVSKSPSNRKPGACAIHSNGRATPLRRSTSRDSLTSLGTSIASSRVAVRLGGPSLGAQRVGGPRASSTPVSAKNALQELLREKQSHLERLMRERELERAEVAKVSLQANRAETVLAQVKKEITQTSTENEKLKTELLKINKQLEDERQKVEDLMFRNEEENINKEDYNRYKEAMEQEKAVHLQRIRKLELESALQTARANATAAALQALEAQRSAEVNAMLDQHKEELTAAQTLSAELQKLLDEAYALLKEKEQEKDSLGKSMSEELSKLKGDTEKALNEAKTKMAIAQTEFETQLSVLTTKLQLTESKLETEKQSLERLNKENSQTIIDLNTKLTQLQAAVDDKTLELNKVTGSSKEHEVNLNKEITKLKMELSAKVLDLEQLDDSKRKQESICKSLEEEMTRVKEEYSAKVNEYEVILNEASQQNEKNKMEILELQKNLSEKTKEYEKLLSESSDSTTSSEKIITEYKQSIHERDKEIIKLKDEYEQFTANFNIKHSKIAEEHKKEIEDRNSKIEQLMKEIEMHKQSLDQSKIELDNLNTRFTLNVDEMNVLKEENVKLKLTIAELTENNNSLKTKLSSMELEIGEHKRQLSSAIEKCEEIQKSKDKIETEYLNITGQATDSNEEFNKLSKHLKETEHELQDLKDKNRELANTHSRIEQELKQNLFKMQENFTLERSQLMQSVNDGNIKLQETENKIMEMHNTVKNTAGVVKELETSNDKLLDEITNLKQEIEDLKQKESIVNNEFDAIRKNLEIEIEKYKAEISNLKAEGATSEVKLIEKVDQLTEAQNDLNNKLEEARKHEDSLQTILNDMTTQLNNQKISFEKEIAQTQSQLVAVTEENNKHKSEEDQLKAMLEEKQNSLKDLSRKLEMLEVDFKSNLEIVNEKDRQIAQVNDELIKVSEMKKQIEEKLNSAALESASLKQKLENLVANSSAEESVLKEQLGQVEILRKEMTVLIHDKSVLEEKSKDNQSELNKLNQEREIMSKKLNKSLEMNSDLQKMINDKDLILNTQVEINQVEINKIKVLEEEINTLRRNADQKDNELVEKEKHLQNINQSLKTGSNESQLLINQLQVENSQLSEKYRNEVMELHKAMKSLQDNLTEKNRQLEELNKLKEKTTTLEQQLENSEKDIKQLNNINEGQKANYEDLNKQLQTQYDELKKESKHIKHDLKSKCKDYEKQLEESKQKLGKEFKKQTDLQSKLIEVEKQTLEQSQKLELMSIQQTPKGENDSKLEKITLELQALRKSYSDALANSEVNVNKFKIDIEHKLNDLKKRDETITKLQEEIKNHKIKIEILEREKALLQKEMTTKVNELKDKNDNTAMGVLGQGDNAVIMPAEKEMIDGQVSFLNSVIVDMQRKNEQLIARVQALESGGGSVSPVFNGRTPRAVAPRLFCDICDVFDAHDTEECPRQAADEAPPPPRRAPPPPRPYCDICEVFGHATENCDEEETF